MKTYEIPENLLDNIKADLNKLHTMLTDKMDREAIEETLIALNYVRPPGNKLCTCKQL